jgi:hypothetical protein
VATRETGALPSSQTYAVKATSDPNTTRYASASQDEPETAPKENPASSPRAAAATSSTEPPAAISTVVSSSGSAGTGRSVTSSEPTDQDSAASTHRAAYAGSVPPEPPGRKISATPPRPTSTPRAVAGAGRSRSSARSTTIHNGVHAISSATSPESTRCSATLTRPFPPASSSMPDTAAVATWVRVARSADRPRRAAR